MQWHGATVACSQARAHVRVHRWTGCCTVAPVAILFMPDLVKRSNLGTSRSPG